MDRFTNGELDVLMDLVEYAYGQAEANAPGCRDKAYEAKLKRLFKKLEAQRKAQR